MTPVDELRHFRCANSRLEQGVRLLVHVQRQFHGILNERDFGWSLEPTQAADDRPTIDTYFGSELGRQPVVEI